MAGASPEFLAKYAMEAVPRYTSYPPATHFHTGVGLADWADWMSRQAPAPQTSIYVHIPFCKTMCWYCGCHTTIPNRHDRIARYLDALDHDICRRAALAPADARVCHIHFGGGSPDMLRPAEFIAIAAEGNIEDAYQVVQIVDGADGIRNTEDDQPIGSSEVMNIMGMSPDEQGEKGKRFGNGQEITDRIESIGFAGAVRRKVVLIIRNRTSGRPTILDRKEETIQ